MSNPTQKGIRSLVWQPDSPTAPPSIEQHESDMRGISKFLLLSLKLMEETLKYILYKVVQTT